MQYYSTMKRNEALIPATSWIHKNIVLREKSQKQRPYTVKFRSHATSRKGTSIDAGSRFRLPEAESRNRD